MTNQGPAFRRILLKLSGEALMGQQGYSIDPGIMQRIAGEVQRVQVLLLLVGDNSNCPAKHVTKLLDAR